MLFRSIMDFSQAQRAAHAEEYARSMISLVAGWDMLSSTAQEAEREARLLEASDFQQGCRTHFQRSIMRVKKDKTVVPPHLLDTFETGMHTLLSPDTSRDEYESTIERLRATFPPLFVGWIDWWTRPSMAAMIFPAFSNIEDDFRQHEIPNTC